MSRRLRIEEEKAKQLKDELAEEEDKLKIQRERIFGPLLWRRFQNGVRIEDLQADRFEDAVNLILEHYLKEDVLFRNTRIKDDPVSQKSFGERLLFKLRDRASIAAIDEEHSDQLVGVLILKPVQKCDFGRVYSRIQLTSGAAYRSYTEFVNYVTGKVDIFQRFDCERYLQYYLLCVHSNYRKKGAKALGARLMMVGCDVARHLKLPVIMGMFTNYRLQQKARKIGMDQLLYEFEYAKWQDRSGGLVFCDPGAGNYACAVQGGVVPPAPPPPQAPPTKTQKKSKK